MDKREKVIKGLEAHSNAICQTNDTEYCPYWGDDNCSTTLSKDALELLKKQEAQEEKTMDGSSCPSCDFFLGWAVSELGGPGNVHFCPHCGQAVKWDE